MALNLKDLIAAQSGKGGLNESSGAPAVPSTGADKKLESDSKGVAAPAKLSFGLAAGIPVPAGTVVDGVGESATQPSGSKSNLTGFKFGGAAPAVSVEATLADSGSVVQAPDSEESDQRISESDDERDNARESGLPDGVVFSVADIGSMDIDALGLSQPATTGFVYRDQVDAQLPDRDLPPELDGEALAYVELLNGIYGIGFDPIHFGNMVRSIMSELQSHPEYTKLMCDEDVHTLMKGMQDSMGMAAIRKSEAKTKRQAKTPASKATNQAMLGAMSGLDDSVFD